jgi:hypothetical protein
VAPHEEVVAELPRFEILEAYYDGLNGKIIPWTLEHGGTSHDPSAQAFILSSEGEFVARAPDRAVYSATSFAKWLKEQADAYEKAHPPTRIPFQRAEVVMRGEDTDRTVVCAALDEAREGEAPILLYFGREERSDQDRAARREVKAARKFERSTLDSQKAADTAEGLVLLRFDLSKEADAALAATFGVEAAPALVLIVPGAEEPEVLPPRLTGASLAYRLKKLREAR